MESNRRRAPRSIAILAVLAIAAGSFSVWRDAQPEEWLRIRVIAALTMSDVWAMGTEVNVRDTTVRLQGFVHHEADRARLVALAEAVPGVDRVRQKLYVTSWPVREPTLDPTQVAFVAGAAN